MLDTLFQKQEGPLVVKSSLNLEHLRLSLRRLLSMLALSTLIYAVLYVVTPDHPRTYSLYQNLSLGYQAFFSLFAPFLIFYLLYFTINLLSLRQLEQRRQAAASGDQRFLAFEQPIPDAYSFSLPLTIKPRPDWSILLVSFVVMLPCVSILALVFSHFRPDPVFDVWLFSISGICVVGFCLFLIWKLSLQRSIQLVVNEDGLTLFSTKSKVQHLAWKDIRLFALDSSLFTINKNQPTLFFEVSGVQEILYWTWKLPDSRHGSTFSQWTSSSKEYDRQMQAVFSLIVARTGLSFYDLRYQETGRRAN